MVDEKIVARRLRRYRGYLENKANVLGTGYGFKEVEGELTDELCLVAYVSEKKPAVKIRTGLIKRELDGVKTDVQEVGAFKIQPLDEEALAQASSERIRHYNAEIPLCVSGGCFKGVTSGNFNGAVVKRHDTQKFYWLTNAHVATGDPRVGVSDYENRVIQPGRYYGGDLPHVGLRRYQTMLDPTIPSETDAALIEPTNPDEMLVLEPIGVAPYSGSVEPRLGVHVGKSGVSSDVTYGVISALDVKANVGYGGWSQSFVNQVAVRGIDGVFSIGGDSGSSIYVSDEGDPDFMAVTALLFAGGNNITLGNPISEVLSDFNCEIATSLGDEPEPPSPVRGCFSGRICGILPFSGTYY